MGSRYTPQGQVSLEETDAPAQTLSPVQTGDKVLRVAVAPVISPEKSLQVYHGFVDYLGDRTDRAPVFLQGDTYAEVNELVRQGRCELALVCTCAFVRGEREFGMDVLAAPQIEGQVTYRSLILVPASSPAKSLLDLRGKRFGSGDILSTSGWLFPATWLMDQGEDPNDFFSEQVLTGSHDQSVRAVLSGYVDGAAVHSQVYEQMVDEDPSVSQRTRVILKSRPYGNPPLVVHPRLDSGLKEKLRTILLNMHTDPEGREILNALRIDRFVAQEPSAYGSVRDAVQVLESG
jgi:phosphonate transport system substrate-binding protein